MAYIGASPSNGIRRKYKYTATAAQTSFTNDDNGITVSYVDSLYVDVFQNGVKLAQEDYTSTTGTSVVLVQAASADDIIEIIVFDVFGVADTVSQSAGGSFAGNVAMAGTLAVTGNTTVGGTLGVTGNTTVGGTFGVTGVSTLSDNIVFGAASKGVYLGVTSATASNLLDDYEEGTWTATINGASCSAAQTARYTKVGTSVIATFYISSITNTNNGTQFQIGGLPFTVVDAALAGGITLGWCNAANLTGWIGIVQSNSTYFYFHVQTGNADARTHANVQSAGLTHLIGTITYRSL
jgi:hypothetical protein